MNSAVEVITLEWSPEVAGFSSQRTVQRTLPHDPISVAIRGPLLLSCIFSGASFLLYDVNKGIGFQITPRIPPDWIVSGILPIVAAGSKCIRQSVAVKTAKFVPSISKIALRLFQTQFHPFHGNFIPDLGLGVLGDRDVTALLDISDLVDSRSSEAHQGSFIHWNAYQKNVVTRSNIPLAFLHHKSPSCWTLYLRIIPQSLSFPSAMPPPTRLLLENSSLLLHGQRQLTVYLL